MECAFLISFVCYYFYEFLGTTMVNRGFFVLPYRAASLVLIALAGLQVLRASMLDRRHFYKVLLILGITGAYMVVRSNKYIFIIGAVLVASSQYSFKWVCGTSLIIGIGILGVVYFLSSQGLIPYLVFDSRGKYLAHALGVNYSTDCAAHWFYLFAGYLVLRDNRIRFWEYPLYLLGIYLLFHITRGRISAACMIILLIMSGCLQLQETLNDKGKRFFMNFSKCLTLVTAVSALISVGMTWVFDSSNEWMSALDLALERRISMGQKALLEYGISLFGHEIPQIGMGRSFSQPAGYFFLDNSYIEVLLERGVLIFLLICGMMTYIAYKAYKRRNYIVLSVVAVIALHCMIEHHLFDLSYNFFLLLALARWDMDDIPDGKVVVNDENQ